MLRAIAVTGAAIASNAAVTAASAHPHVWIDARAEIRVVGDRPVSIHHEWTFDPAYSAFLTMGVAKGPDGRSSEHDLDAAAGRAVSSLMESEYFTDLKAGGIRMARGTPVNVSMRLDAGRAVLSFDLPLTEKYPDTATTDGTALDVMDPGYFVAFTFAPGDDAVTLKGAPSGCRVTIKRPLGFTSEDARTLAAGVLTALVGPGAGDRIGNRAEVSCPVH